MGFFETFWVWLNGQLTTYVGDNTVRLAGILEPAIVTLATVYVMIWGYLQLTGSIEEPLATGLKRILVLAIVLGMSLHLWLYNSLIVDTFYRAPAQLAAAVVGAADPVRTLDTIWESGGGVAGELWTRAHAMFSAGFFIAAIAIWLLVGALCVYAMFLIALADIALAVLLALGPLFIVLLMFETTRRFFSAWIAQLANYGLITILTVMVGTLLLQIVQTFAAQTAARGNSVQTVDVLNMLLLCALVLLVLRQVMPIAAGLAGGISLNGFGVVSRMATSAGRTFRPRSMQAAVYSAPHVGQTLRAYGAPVWHYVRGPRKSSSSQPVAPNIDSTN